LPEIARIGKNLHLAGETFWQPTPSSIDSLQPEKQLWDRKNLVEQLLSIGNNLKQLRQYIDSMFSRVVVESDELTSKLSKAFVQFESERISEIFTQLGVSRSVIDRYVIPVATEIAIENYSNKTMGIIDRIDRTTNDAYIVIEYKFGKPKYADVPWQYRLIMRELCFYRLLLEGNSVYVVNDGDGNLQHISEKFDEKPLPYYGSMIFFADVANSQCAYTLNKRSVNACRKAIERYWNAMNEGMYKPTVRITPHSDCADYCQFFTYCSKNREWDEIIA
jgi:hypothetical protein